MKKNGHGKMIQDIGLYKKAINSLIGEKLVKLILVCWIGINIQMSKIQKGKYKLYIRYGVFKFSEEKLKLIIKLNDQIIYNEKYPKKYMIDDCKLNEKEDRKFFYNRYYYK